MTNVPYVNEVQPLLPLPQDKADWVAWANDLPASQAMGMRALECVPGRAKAVLEHSVWPLNPNGSVHGGLLLGVSDHLGGCVAMTMMPSGEYCATATLTMQFMSPAVLPLTFEAVVTRSGRTLAFVDLAVTSSDGRRCATVVGSWSMNLLSTVTRR